MNDARRVMATGLWGNNAALVQLLGLCPLLAVTTTVVNGLTLGLATAAVLTATNTAVSLVRKSLVPVVRIPLFVLIIASLVTCVDLLTNAFLNQLHQILGLFIPLIITNCAILAQAETVASRRPVGESALSGFATGIGSCAVLVVLGGLREALGHGTLFAGFAMLAGRGAAGWTLHLPFHGMLVAVLPPGAFFGLAALIALRNLWNKRREAKAAAANRMPAAETAA